MDRPINSQHRIKNIVKKLFGVVLIVSMLVGCFTFVWFWLSPSIKRVRIRTATVDRGAIEASVTASGTILPEVERVVSSPIDARIVKILKHVGDKVSKNEAIIELDTNASILALEKLNQELSLRENRQKRTLLSLEEKVNQIKSQEKIKQLDLDALKAQVKQNRKLFEQGLLAENVYRQSELSEAKTIVELKQLEEAKETAEEASKTEIAGLDLEILTLKKEQEEAKRLLELATTRSDRDGVLTWVVLEEGTTIRKGDVVARIADLKSYRLEANISDIHAKVLSLGQSVKVKINDDYLNGTLTNILPTIKDGAITLAISLTEKTSPLLRPNLKVDVLVITSKKDSILRIKKGPFVNGDGKQEVFVIRDNIALKVPVTIGIASFDTYEIINGLIEGDEVIISDMRDYIHLKEIKVD